MKEQTRKQMGRPAAEGRKRRMLKAAGWASLSVLLIAAGMGLYFYLSVKHTADRMYEPLPVSNAAEAGEYTAWRQQQLAQLQREQRQQQLEGAEDTQTVLPAFTLLLLGVDEREEDRGRADAILLMTVNPNNSKLFMFNIPRDTRTLLVKRGFEDKINHAYAYDGIAGTVATIENFIDLPIDYYVQVNMEGFEAIIDMMDGVDVDNPFAFDFLEHHYPAGQLHLSGERALGYIRMRFDDPRGDLGRTERQRQVVRDLIRRASRWESLPSIPKVLDALGDHVRTNLTFADMQRLMMKYRTRIKTIESTEINGHGANIGGIYYFIVDDQERARIHDRMKEELLGQP